MNKQSNYWLIKQSIELLIEQSIDKWYYWTNNDGGGDNDGGNNDDGGGNGGSGDGFVGTIIKGYLILREQSGSLKYAILSPNLHPQLVGTPIHRSRQIIYCREDNSSFPPN